MRLNLDQYNFYNHFSSFINLLQSIHKLSNFIKIHLHYNLIIYIISIFSIRMSTISNFKKILHLLKVVIINLRRFLIASMLDSIFKHILPLKAFLCNSKEVFICILIIHSLILILFHKKHFQKFLLNHLKCIYFIIFSFLSHCSHQILIN